MKRFWKNLGWICLGIFLQFKFNVLYGIVFLENLNFHERTYMIKMNLVPSEEKVKDLHVETIVHHSLGPDYFANIYIPVGYKVLNRNPYQGAESIPGYNAYKMDMKRKYRDVLAQADFIITAGTSDKDRPPAPVMVYFENLNQRLHTDKTYLLSVVHNQIQLEGPKLVEAQYHQKLGM